MSAARIAGSVVRPRRQYPEVMKSWDFWIERTVPGPDPWAEASIRAVLDEQLLKSITHGPLADRTDIEVAVAWPGFAQ